MATIIVELTPDVTPTKGLQVSGQSIGGFVGKLPSDVKTTDLIEVWIQPRPAVWRQVQWQCDEPIIVQDDKVGL